MTAFDPRFQTHLKSTGLTPSDGVTFPATKGIYVGGAAARTLTVVDGEGNLAVFANVPPGTYLPVSITALANTGTTATALEVVALY